jgi:ABC-type glycerol-3-phosphate transport system substrate-binding protein
MILLYRSEIEGGINWENIFAGDQRLSFSAGDPQGLFGLSLYISAGGEILNASGLPALDSAVLVKVLSWVQEGVFAGVVSPSLKNVSTEEHVKIAYRTGNADMAIAWLSNLPELGFIAPVPGLGDSNHSFATGWVWALAGSNPENQQLAIELAEYLVADDFIGDWTRTAGYLPTRPSSAVDEGSATIAIVESAHAIPSNEVLLVLGPLMQEALTRVLNGEQPEVVAGSVIEKLK